MRMRVTNNMMMGMLSTDMFRNTSELLRASNTMASGKRINTPSDDPIGAGKVLGYRKLVSSIEQYRRNMNHARTWLEAADSALDRISEFLRQAKRIAVSQSTGTVNEESRVAASEQVQGIYDQILHLANTKVGENYIFAGYSTKGPAFASDGTYNGDHHSIETPIGENVNIQYNLIGEDVFRNGTDIFNVVHQLQESLANNDQEGISDQIPALDNALNQISTVRSTLGARLDQLDNTEQYWDDFDLKLNDMISKTEDIDMAKAMTDLVQKQTAYETSLKTVSMVVQTNLLNFLR